MKKIIVFLCVVVTVILAAGCLYNGNADRTTPTDAVNLEALQKLYKKAPEYEYMALAYYKDGFSGDDMVRDAYIPYEENYVQTDENSVYGRAHGIGIRQHIKQGKPASEVNKILADEFVKKLESENISDYEMGASESFDNDTIATTIATYTNLKNEKIHTILYTDIRDNGNAYLCAEIEINPAEFDSESKALLKEVEDVFGMNFSRMGI